MPNPESEFALEISKAIEEVKPKKEPIPEPLSFLELEALDLPATEWLMGKTIPWPGLIAVSGKPGSFKTFFALWLAMRASAGLPLFDEQTFSTLGEKYSGGYVPTLFIEEENTVRLIRERAISLKKADYSRMFFYIDCGFKMTDEDWRKKTIDFVKLHGIKLIVLDPFSSVMGLKDENSNAEVSTVMDLIRKEFIKNDVSVIFIHHPSKGEEGGKNLRGAGDILGKCDVHLSLEKEPTGEIVVSYEKMRVADENTMSNFRMRLKYDELGRNGRFEYVGEAKPKWEEEQEVLQKKIVDCLTSSCEVVSRREVADYCGVSNTGDKFVKVWGKMIEKGEILEAGKGKFRLKNSLYI